MLYGQPPMSIGIRSNIAGNARELAAREISRTVRSGNKLVTRSSRVCLLLTAYTCDRP